MNLEDEEINIIDTLYFDNWYGFSILIGNSIGNVTKL